jgi:hypothetical protein
LIDWDLISLTLFEDQIYAFFRNWKCSQQYISVNIVVVKKNFTAKVYWHLLKKINYTRVLYLSLHSMTKLCTELLTVRNKFSMNLSTKLIYCSFQISYNIFSLLPTSFDIFSNFLFILLIKFYFKSMAFFLRKKTFI